MTELVQPIVLLRSGSHEDAVRCVAEASLRAYVSAPDLPDWEAWLAGSSTKTVRRPAVVWVAGDPTHVEGEEELGVASLLGDACHQLLERHLGEAPVGVGVQPGAVDAVDAVDAERAGGSFQLCRSPLAERNARTEGGGFPVGEAQHADPSPLVHEGPEHAAEAEGLVVGMGTDDQQLCDLGQAGTGALPHAHHPSVVGMRRPRRAVAR